MRYLNGIICLGFIALALLQLDNPHPIYWFSVFAWGAILAFLSLVPHVSRPMARFLAIITTVAMFFYFAGFFRLAPSLHQGWAASAGALEAIGLLFGAFAMIPILSVFSCRLKAKCYGAQKRQHLHFFSTTEH